MAVNDYNRNSPLTGAVASSFIKAFQDEMKSNSYALVLSQKPNDDISGEAFSPQRDYNSVAGLMLATLPEWSVARCAKRYKWTPKSTFVSWKSTENMFGKKFYCDHRITSGKYAGAWAVQLCINTPLTGTVSVNPPDQISATPFKTADGYEWMTLFLISGRLRQFVDSKVIPVPDQMSIDEEWKKYRSTDPVLIKKDLEELSRLEPGKIMAVNISDWDSIQKLRWEDKPTLLLNNSAGGSGRDANIKANFRYITDSNYSDNQGWQLTGFDIIDGGYGYNTSDAYTMSFNSSPKQTQMNTVKVTTLDHIFGGARLTYPNGKVQKDSLIKLTISGPTGFADAQAILYGDILKINILVSADQIKENLPDGLDISSVTLVKEPYIEGVKASKKLKKTKGYESPSNDVKIYRAYDKITTTSSSAISNKSFVRTTASSAGKKGSGQIASSSTVGSSTEYIVINGKNFEVGGKLYNATQGGTNSFTPESSSVKQYGISDATALSKGTGYSTTDSSASEQTITAISLSPVSFGTETQVMGTFDFNDTEIERSREGVLVKLTLTNDDYIK